MLNLNDMVIIGTGALEADLVYFVTEDGLRTNNVNVARGWHADGMSVEAVISLNNKKVQTGVISRFYKQKDSERYVKVTAGKRRIHLVPSKERVRYLNNPAYVFEGKGEEVKSLKDLKAKVESGKFKIRLMYVEDGTNIASGLITGVNTHNHSVTTAGMVYYV